MATIQFQKIQKMLRRPRRNRKSQSIRNLVEETKLTSDDFVLPLFLVDGNGIDDPINSLPIASRKSIDHILKEVESALKLDIHSFMMFPAIPENHKDKVASYSYDENNFYLKAAETIKKEFPQITLISDVAMDPYSIDGHDGLVENGEIVNDPSLEILTKMSVAQAQAGFDMIGPSDMMDFRVEAIREALDENGFENTAIMSYTAKYASAFYGPFRDALDSAPADGADIPKHKKSYQMNPANKRESLIEAELDFMEGADIMMVKPALNYLDVIHLLKENFDIPIAAYHVSGECAMLIAAAQNGWLNLDDAMSETLLSIKRAGADIIISYFAKHYASLKKESLGN